MESAAPRVDYQVRTMTERQLREIEYHKKRAVLIEEVARPVLYNILDDPERRWWNHHWSAYAMLFKQGIVGKSILIPGCGDGHDAIRLSRAGAEVHAFDISQDMLRTAQNCADHENVSVCFRAMPAEEIDYPDNSFDMVFARDILHHCDVARCICELVRVIKPGGYMVIDELYTHHQLQRIRESRVGRWLRTRLVPVIYPFAKVDVYVTEDERKLSDSELTAIKRAIRDTRSKYFAMIVDRFLPNWELASKLDRLALKLLGPAGCFFAGRFIVAGVVRK
jgi:ubiquinone/menaquinone biosynthesis C-methylase UbiE